MRDATGTPATGRGGRLTTLVGALMACAGVGLVLGVLFPDNPYASALGAAVTFACALYGGPKIDNKPAHEDPVPRLA